MNEILFFVDIVFCFSFDLLFYKFFGKKGLFVWIAIATIISNIQTVKIVNIFGVETSLGNVLYGSTFLATDILNEYYGKEEARKSIYYGFTSMVVMTLLMSISLLFNPSVNDFASDSLNLIFTLNIRITIASIVGFCVSQFLDTWTFQYIKQHNDKLWVRNNLSTMISQVFDTVLFVTISYIGTVPFSTIIQLMMSMYVFKFFIAIFDTPFMYLSKKVKPLEDGGN